MAIIIRSDSENPLEILLKVLDILGEESVVENSKHQRWCYLILELFNRIE